MRITAFTTILLSLLLACGREETVGFEPELPIGEVEYFIFGTNAPECAADCFQYYKLTNEGLFGLKKYTQRTKKTKFSYQKESLSATEVSKARDLLKLFPPDLLSQPDRMGCPGCNDSPAIFVQIKQGNRIQNWSMEGDPGSHPSYLRPFTQRLMDLVFELEN
jgi:hypothetical protein